VYVKSIPSFLATCIAPWSLASKTAKPSSFGTIETLIVGKVVAAAPAEEDAAVRAIVAPIATQAAAAPIFQTSLRWMVLIGFMLCFSPLFIPLYEAVNSRFIVLSSFVHAPMRGG
jgi:hypothetical protein